MLSFSDVSLARGPRTLLSNVNFAVYAGYRVGVVGRNGTGKSSLFQLVTGELGPDRGNVSLPKQLVMASVAQETPASPQAALEYALDGDTELRKVEAELAAAEDAHDADGIGHGHERLHAIGGYSARARAAKLLHGLGFEAADQLRPVAEFSGGWRMRLNLAHALLCRSDLLLLDEPTNHLDLDTVLWLESWLTAYEGTMLVISHDRDFLDAVTTHTLHLAEGTATLYTGNYSQFERLRAERLAQQSATRTQQIRQVAHLQSFVDRFGASAAKARQAQARVKMIERIKIAAPAHADAEFEFEIPTPDRLPEPLISLNDAAVGYGERIVLKGIKMTLSPGDRIGLLGPNGAGKSTLTRLLAGELEARSGAATRHPYLKVGYFAQHQLEQLDMAASPIEHFRRLDGGASEQALRTYLGGFHFKGDRVFEAVAPFSGGEKARLALALVVYRKPNLLLLDEPTNHLDLDLRHAVEIALQDFPGALVLVTHDRHLVESTCDTLWRVSDGQVVPFDGDLDDYARWLSQREREYARRVDKEGVPAVEAKASVPVVAASVAAPAPTRTVTPARPAESAPKNPGRDQRRSAADQRAAEKPLREALKRAELGLTRVQEKLEEIEAKLQDTTLYEGTRRDQLADLLREQAQLKERHAEAEETWLAAASALESATAP